MTVYDGEVVEHIVKAFKDVPYVYVGSDVVATILKLAAEYEERRVLRKEELEADSYSAGWQARKDGHLLAETNDPADFRQLGLLDEEGVKFIHIYERRTFYWIEDDPKVEIERREKEGPRF